MSEWIDVNDELPPLFEEVQLFVPELEGDEVVAWSMWQGMRIYEKGGWIRAGTMEGVEPPFAVTHWRPLPRPPGTPAAPSERPTTPLSQIDEIKLRKALERAWRLLDRGASREQAIGVIADALGTNEVPDAGVGETLDWPSDDVIAEVLERSELGRELIAWAADEENVEITDEYGSYCVFPGCNAYKRRDDGTYEDHTDNCLHLRARALRGDDDVV